MELTKIQATKRTGRGKGSARRLRQDGMIPAVAYGKELAPQALSVAPKDLTDVLGSDYGPNTVLELSIEDEAPITALLRDFQYHPVKRTLLHADFLQVDLDRPVEVQVPLDLTGRAIGVVEGGVLRQVYRKLPMRCLPRDIPIKVTYDVTELVLGATVAVQDLALPEGVTVLLDPEQTVAAVGAEARPAEAEEAAAEGAAAEGEAPPTEEGETPAEPSPTPDEA